MWDCCLSPASPPRPFTPDGVKGSWNSQFGFLSLDGGLAEIDCGAGLQANIGECGSRSKWRVVWALPFAELVLALPLVRVAAAVNRLNLGAGAAAAQHSRRARTRVQCERQRTSTRSP